MTMGRNTPAYAKLMNPQTSDQTSHSGAQMIRFAALCINMHIFRSIFRKSQH